jgi:3-hydroxyisobutyrate dehydrogenase
MTTIAFLGLGHMGGPMAANLLAAGHTVHGFDPVPAAQAAAAEKGAQIFDTGAAAVAAADVVITSLPNGEIVKTCYAEVLPTTTHEPSIGTPPNAVSPSSTRQSPAG